MGCRNVASVRNRVNLRTATRAYAVLIESERRLQVLVFDAFSSCEPGSASLENALPGTPRCKNERPEHLILGVRSIARRYAQFCDTALEHIGIMRRRAAPT